MFYRLYTLKVRSQNITFEKDSKISITYRNGKHISSNLPLVFESWRGASGILLLLLLIKPNGK